MEEKELIIKFLEEDTDKKLNLNVIGDPMIDEYFHVDVSRISPEFPIPVYKSNTLEPSSGLIPGGAANVAYQFNYFNVNVELICLINKLSQVVFDSKDIKTNHSKVVDPLFLPVKKRIYSEDVPLVRWDIEKENYGLEDINKHLMDLVIPDSDCNIFSDYSKGLFKTPWFRKFIKKTKSVVDPKNNFIDFWEDCTVFKPNAHEASLLSDKKLWKDQAEFFMDSIRCKSVVITQSGNGVVGKDDSFFEVRPETKVEKPNSVIGAGDCFIAFLTMAICRGFSIEDAARIAFAAGTFYVQRKYNKPISPAELFSSTGKKLVTKPEILAKRNFKLVFTNGCYDLLHAGHLNTLKFSKNAGDKLCVGLNSDESIKKLKGDSRPIVDLKNRIKMLESLDVVDYIVVFEEETPEEVIKKIRPDTLVKGEDYRNKKVVGSNYVDELLFAPMQEGLSTTNIIEIIKQNNK